MDDDLIKSEMNSFLEDLLIAANVVNVPEDQKIKYKEELSNELALYINVRILENLSKEKLKEYEALLRNNPTSEKLREFCTKNIKNYDELMQKVLMEFGNIYLGQEEKNAGPRAR